MDDPVQQVFSVQEVEVWPLVTWKPKWGLTFAEIKSKVSGSCSISQRSTMVLKGRDIFVDGLSLDGALIISSVDGAEVFHDKLMVYACYYLIFSSSFFFLIFFLAPFCNKFNRFVVFYKLEVLSIDYEYQDCIFLSLVPYFEIS